MKYTTESSAWAAIARQLQRDNKMPRYVFLNGDEALANCDGLCAVLARMQRLGEISAGVQQKMQNRVTEHLALRNDTNWHDRSSYLVWPGRVAPRIIAAQLLALEAKEDEQREVRA